jgi:transposase
MKNAHPEKQSRAAELYSSGKTVIEIARELEVAIPTISRWLARAGLREIATRIPNPKRDAAVVADYAAGITVDEICKKHDISRAQVVTLARRAGIGARQTGPRFHDIGKAIRNRITKLWNDGLPAQVIAKEIDLHIGVVRRVMLEEGIEYKPRSNGDGTGRWHKGEWRREDHGYIRVRVLPEDPLFCMADKTGYVLEHRYVMAQKLGRPLTDQESVHHKDNNPQNNKRSNLQLRSGQHGKHAAFRCRECGSRNIVAAPLENARKPYKLTAEEAAAVVEYRRSIGDSTPLAANRIDPESDDPENVRMVDPREYST